MADDIINFDIKPVKPASIKVIGVGGGGGNAVNHMYEQGIRDVEFILCNTDAQALAASPVPNKIQLGENTTHGRGAGNNPENGKESAIEAINEIEKVLADNTQMVFVTAGMGGGTGTGAAPIIAKTAKEMGILTVGIVTVPFRFEGNKRIDQAIKGLEELRDNVDSLLVISNDRLREMFGNLPMTDAFKKADDILSVAAKGIAEIITVPGNVNVDFADVSTVMKDSGVALMGSATANGEDRAITSIMTALNSPLLNNADIKGAKNILLNFTSGEMEITMDEMSEITDFIIEQAGHDVNMIWGSVADASLEDNLRVTIIATGFEMDNLPDVTGRKKVTKERINLNVERKNLLENSTDSSNSNNDSIKEKQTSIPFNEEAEVYPEINLINTGRTKTPEKKEQLISKTTGSKGKSAWQWEDVKQQEDITEWEKIPAYKRKQLMKELNIEDEESKDDSEGQEVSRFTLSKDGKGVSLKDNNAFLDDNVD